VRDEVERVLRSWDRFERDHGNQPVIDYDCINDSNSRAGITSAKSRLEVFEKLTQMRETAERQGLDRIVERLTADLALLSAYLGERASLDDYLERTQGCKGLGWSDRYVDHRGEIARKALGDLDIAWSADTRAKLDGLSRQISAEDIGDLIRSESERFEPSVREFAATSAKFDLTVAQVELDEYWGYWIDGVGKDVRLRLNLRNARFTAVTARIFALHEILGHGLQYAGLAEEYAPKHDDWVRLLSVHALYQVTFEGLAQALPLMIIPDDRECAAHVRLAHFEELVRSELHRMIAGGALISDCLSHARSRIPYWSNQYVVNLLHDRGNNAVLRSYLWAYPAGIDWVVNLAEAGPEISKPIVRELYHEPFTPSALQKVWSDGPPVGGSG